MVKDYFQDIVPPQGGTARKKTHATNAQNDNEDERHEEVKIPIRAPEESADIHGRSIRNISIPARTRNPYREGIATAQPPTSRGISRFWIWGAAIVCILILIAVLVVALRPTSVTITPRSHTITFSGQTFSALPESSSLEGVLSYGMHTVNIEDSEVVPSSGKVYAEDKATGNLTVYNNYQTTPLKLVKNTRFSTPSGLIFRAPAEVVVPAKSGSTPGKIQITVVADEAGAEYNVPAGTFKLPGLQSTPSMYRDVYAESSDAFVGGFVGERPGVAAEALESAIATVRSRLAEQAEGSLSQIPQNSLSFPALWQIDYQTLPNTEEAGGGVRIHQVATINIPIFDAKAFAVEVGSTAINASDESSISLMQGPAFTVAVASSTPLLGSSPLQFTILGSATLVWGVNVEELRQALAGKDQGAFEAIVGGFSSVQEANARIEPFWKKTFPTDPSKIKVVIREIKNTE